MSDKSFISASHFGAFQAELEHGTIKKITALPIDQQPNQMIQGIIDRSCAKNRILHPYVREGYLRDGYQSDRSQRGNDKFIQVSWDTAFDLVAAELKRVYSRYGYQGIYGGSYGWYSVGNLHNPQVLLGRMLSILGGYISRTETYSTHAIRTITPYITGVDESTAPITPLPNIIEHSECVVFWGCNPIITNRIAWFVPDHSSFSYFNQLKEKGQQRNIKFYSIDPVHTDTAKFFNAEHIDVRPGTDVALMLGIAHYLYTNKLYDHTFVEKYTIGFDEFRDYLLGHTDDHIAKNPTWAATVCGIDETIIITLAKQFIEHRTMLMAGWGVQRSEHGEQPHWMLIVLAAMLGQIGLPGGGYGFSYHYSDNGAPKVGAKQFPGLPSITSKSALIGAWQQHPMATIPVSRIVDCLNHPNQPYTYQGKTAIYPEIKLAYWAGGNPFHHHPDRNHMLQAWQKLDTFIVHDCYWTASARMADIVLPATIEQEREDITKSSTNRFILAMKQLTSPVGEAKDDYDIFVQILTCFDAKAVQAFTEGKSKKQWLESFYQHTVTQGKLLGIDLPSFNDFWQQGWLEFTPLSGEGNKIKMQDFRLDPDKYPLPTPSGKIEITSTLLKNFSSQSGFNYSYPHWLEPDEWLGSQLTQDYPLHLVSPHAKYRLHSQLNNTHLREREEIKQREPIWIHPEDAKNRGLKTGDVVRIFNQRGQILGGVLVSEDVKPGVVKMQQGAWYNPKEQGQIGSLCIHGDINVLISNESTSGLAQGNRANALVEIEKYHQPLPEISVFYPPSVVDDL